MYQLPRNSSGLTSTGMAAMRQVTRFLLTLGMVAPIASRVTAQSAAPSNEAQIAAAVLALPEEFRASATVLSIAQYPTTVLRQGTGPMICLADDPKEARFHVACYHKDLDPFMARGRELRARGVVADSINPIRNAEVSSGKIPMPKQGGAVAAVRGARFDGLGQQHPARRPCAVRGVHARRHHGVHRHPGNGPAGHAVAHVPRHAARAHHVHSHHVMP